MMIDQRNCSANKQSDSPILGRLSTVRTSRRLPYLAGLAVIVLVTLACGLGGSAAREIVVYNRLPTLTRTPLPTLTPTGLAAPKAVPPPATGKANTSAPAASPQNLVVEPAASAGMQNHLPTAIPDSVDAPVSNEVTTSTQPTAVAVIPSPTLTETPFPTPTPTDDATPTPTPTFTPESSPTSTATATPLFESGGWSFVSVRNFPDEFGDGLLVYGDVINNTGAAQTLIFITGEFYDPQGQVIADEDGIFDYWPFNIIPPGGRVPFELTVYDIQSAANFNLSVGAEPSQEFPRQDFEFMNLSQSSQENDYCLSGSLRNLGAALENYLVVVAVLYDSQANVVNFGDYYASDIGGLVGDQTIDFEVCADAYDQEVTNYDLRGWGE